MLSKVCSSSSCGISSSRWFGEAVVLIGALKSPSGVLDRLDDWMFERP